VQAGHTRKILINIAQVIQIKDRLKSGSSIGGVHG
jgi:hypothetical protein